MTSPNGHVAVELSLQLNQVIVDRPLERFLHDSDPAALSGNQRAEAILAFWHFGHETCVKIAVPHASLTGQSSLKMAAALR
jgi:hypothetical protein